MRHQKSLFGKVANPITARYLGSFRFILSAMLLGQLHGLFAQNSIVNVDHFTGTASAVIPLFTVENGGISVPISLVYSGTGVKVKDIEGSAGMNWELYAGGQITRQIRGLPDDSKKDILGNARLGWLYNNNGTKINNFSIANDSNAGTCTDEVADINYVNANFSDLSDTEPDIFFVNAPGLSCKLVFDNNHTIRTIPYQDLKITYSTNAEGGIESFTIINDQGIKYTFDYHEIVTRTAKAANPSAVSFFKREFNLYQNGIKYPNSWKISSIKDPAGNEIFFESLIDIGSPAQMKYNAKDSVNVIKGLASGSSSRQFQYAITETATRVMLTNIYYISEQGFRSWKFKYRKGKGASLIPGGINDRPKPIIDTIETLDRTIALDYYDGGDRLNNRKFLKSVQTVGCGILDRYEFDYNGKNAESFIQIADSTSRKVDYWGFYNAGSANSLTPLVYINPSNSSFERYRAISAGSNTSYSLQLNGSSRTANPAVVTNGSLSKIIYPTGGFTTITYESHDYYDPTAGMVIQGGGIRVKEIKDHDNINDANAITKAFSYTNPSTGQSSGKPVEIPQYAFTTPYTGSGTMADQWNYSTVRLEENLLGDYRILYGWVKESQATAGSTTYEFSLPATYWDASGTPDWTPTLVYNARPSCSALGFLTNSKNIYPFPPNPNYDFERGLLKKKILYNESGQKVRETSYTYQRTGAPQLITGFKFDDNAGVMAYAKYSIFTSVGELISQETQKIFDQISGLEQIKSRNYYYTGTHHKLPKRIDETGSDGVIQRTYIQYSKDFNVPNPSADIYVAGINQLQLSNINVPLERQFQREQNGSTRTTGAELTLFKEFNPTALHPFYMPSEHLAFNSGNGVTDFTPSSCSSTGFIKDPRYKIKQRYLAYDAKGNIQTSEDNKKLTRTFLKDGLTQQVVADFNNASFNEIAFNDFDSELKPVRGFIKMVEGYTYLPGRTGNRALSLEPAQLMSNSFNKKANTENYIFSAWVKTAAPANVTFTLDISGPDFVLPVSGNTWKYYEIKIPVGSVSNVFTGHFKSNQNIVIDDILFYPETATVTTFSYDPLTFLKTSETNTNGVSNHYTYDKIGRLRYVQDQDKQFVLKKTYVDKGNAQDFNNITSLSGNYNTNLYTATPATFSVHSFCPDIFDGLTYKWNFGDGSAEITSSNRTSPSHSYALPGNYTVSVVITSPIWGTKTLTNAITVLPGSINFMITSNVSSGSITGVTFYQNGVYVGSMPGTLNTPYALPQGSYEVQINYRGSSSFKSITVDNGEFPNCMGIGSASGNILVLVDAFGSGPVIISANNQNCQL